MKMRPIRKLAAILFLVLALLLADAPSGLVWAEGEADVGGTQNTSRVSSSRMTEAAAVLEYLLGSEFFTGESVTRAEFTGALIRSFSLQTAEVQGVFQDVTEATPYAAEIGGAYAAGIVSRDVNFEPDAPVLYEQAVKMVMHALGYGGAAEYYGGYPAGYLRAANRIDLLRSLPQTTGGLTVGQTQLLLYNLLTCTIQCTGVEDGMLRFEKTETDYLEELYRLRRTEGVVTGTQYNSYRTEYAVRFTPCLEIEGVAYSCEESSPDLLGLNVCAYYHPDDVEIKLLVPLENKELTVERKDITQLKDGSMTYYENSAGKPRTCRVDNAITIYNGRAVTGADLDSFTGDSGKVRLVDNNRDGAYEYLFVYDYTYLYADQMDEKSESISDQNGKESSYLPAREDSETILLGADGKQIEFADIRKGDLLTVARSQDGALTILQVCGRQISGVVAQVKSDDRIMIDDAEYDITAYARRHYAALLTPGIEGVFILGRNNDVVAVNAGSVGMQYGYLVDGVLIGGIDPQVQLKIYSQSGKLGIYQADKVRLNAQDKKVKGEDLLSALSEQGSVVPQLIRFSTDSKQERVMDLDTAETEFDFAEKPEEDRDSLRKYTFTRGGGIVTSFAYRSGGKSCVPYFNLKSPVIFVVPKDDAIKTAEAREFSIIGAENLSSSKSYPFEVYDLSESGSAGALVLKGSKAASGQSYLIESVASGLLADQSIGTVLSVYGRQSYKLVYLTDELADEVGKPLCAGDVVELILDEQDHVMEIALVFDASGGIPVPNTGVGGDVKFEDPGSISYFYGALYTTDGTYGYLSKTEDGAGGYLYDFPNLINLKLQTNNMAIINAKRNEVRPITINELKDYISFGGGNYYIVLRQNYQSPEAVFVYER